MTPDPQAVREAVNHVTLDGHDTLKHLFLLLDAARAFLNLYTTCETCHGSGEVNLGGWDQCPNCAGRGQVIAPHVVEAAADSIGWLTVEDAETALQAAFDTADQETPDQGLTLEQLRIPDLTQEEADALADALRGDDE